MRLGYESYSLDLGCLMRLDKPFKDEIVTLTDNYVYS